MRLVLTAPAKINLTLEVLGKRSDGYHDITSVLQAVDLCDTITVAPANEIRFTCDSPQLITPDNLVLRAAQALQAATGCKRGVEIHLAKRIPVGAGLGGGSSDAAATLKGIAQLWGLPELSRDRLAEIGAQLGMDVPFFLYGGTALAQGRGENISTLAPLRPTWFVLLYPRLAIADKTAKMYRSLSPENYTSGEATCRLVGVIRNSGSLDDSLLFNVFAGVADGVFGDLGSTRRRFAELSGRPVHLSGAGPTLFCLACGEQESLRLRERLVAEGFEAYAVASVGRE